MKILVSYRGIPQSPDWATGDMVVAAFRELGHEVTPYAKHYKQETWVEQDPSICTSMVGALTQEYDLVLFMECNDDDVQYTSIKEVKSRKTACWLFDNSYYPDQLIGLVNFFGFDHHFLANPLTVEQYKGRSKTNVHWLPYACDRRLHERSLEYPKTRDVALVGSVRNDRIALIDELCELGINAELIGDVFREDYVNTLASSRIIINQNPQAGRGLLNMRHFEAQAAGCMLFEQNNDLKINVRAGLDPNYAVWEYNDTEDLSAGISALITDKDTLSTLVSQSQESFLKNNDYVSRCRTILETVFPNESN